MWLRLRGKGHDVARCTVERLMRELGITGAQRAKKPPRTTVPNTAAARPADLVDRDFTATRPNQLWCADFSYVSTWEGMVYVAFVFDVFSRRILGWRAATSMTTDLVLDTLDMALWTRRKDGHADLCGLVHHTDAGSQYTSIAFTERLLEAGVDASVGSVGDAYDNALAETTIGLYKNECVRCDSPFRRGPLQALTDVELITADWVSWYNQQRLMHRLGRIPPAEAEAHYYAQRVAGRPTGSQRPEGA
jgi:putative transposase